RSRRTVPDGADYLVHAAAAWRDKGTFRVKDRCKAVGAETGVLADPPVVEDGQLLSVIRVAPVGHPLRILRVGETDSRACPVAGGLQPRPPEAAQGQRGTGGVLSAQPFAQVLGVRPRVGPVVSAAILGRAACRGLAQLLEPRAATVRPVPLRQLECEIL